MFASPAIRLAYDFRRGLFGALLVAVTVAGVRPAQAGWPHDPYLGNLPVCLEPSAQAGVRACSDGAGGMIVVWEDSRNATAPDLYAQRINATGDPMWTTNGIALCVAANQQNSASIVADGAGGAIVVWRDGLAGAYDIYAQRVNANGALQWAVRGVPVSAANNSQQAPRVISDGAGGAVVAWQDFRNNVHDDIYAQRLNAAGVAQWTADGVALCTATGAQTRPHLVSDGAAGAIVAWQDARAGANTAIYARRVNAGVAQWAADGVAMVSGAFPALDPEIETDLQGGAIVVWQDQRGGAGVYGVYAQRVNPAGVTQWTSNGVSATTETGGLSDAYPCSDGAGGVIVGWDIFRASTGFDVVAQRIGAGGANQWGAAGMSLMSPVGDQFLSAIVSDGTGGAIVAIQNYGFDLAGDIYAQHVLASGTRMGPAAGIAVSASVGSQATPVLVPGGSTSTPGSSGAIVAWRDLRSDPNLADVYSQQVDFNGELGDAAPVIQSVRDLPNDQGGQVKVTWNSSYVDRENRYTYLYYHVWRSVPTNTLADRATLLRRGVSRDAGEASETNRLLLHAFAGTDYAWELVDGQQALHLPSYSSVVSTTSDSIAGSNPRTAFMIEFYQNGVSPQQYWLSSPDSGYSVDNLKPATPAPFAGFYNAGTTRLTWNPNREADLAGYRVYRGVTPGFVPSPATLFAALTDTGYVDQLGPPHVYKLVAVDIHGNESAPATFMPTATVGAPGANVAALDFAPPSPNPASGTTLLRFALPRAGSVRLAVYDPSGRRVRTLREGLADAGEHAVPFALEDDAGRALASGLYLVRLEAGGAVLTRRVMAVH